ncbi:Translin [Orchesella cincta]|uniref:Translin n=1 Tax=Orchesella cincta TaxID=48709 RepID=A0A1D2N5Y9_ORCCI|nr:Translin [Orchesella cincta]
MASADQEGNGDNQIDQTIWNVIEHYQKELDGESELRDKIRTVVKEIDRDTKKINFILLSMHSKPTEENLKVIAAKARRMFETSIRVSTTALKEVVPVGDHYKYNDHWRITFQRLAFVAATTFYLETGTVCTLRESADLIGIMSAEDKESVDFKVFLDYEDYLVGLVDMSAELSRLARNCITFGDNIAKVYSIHECMNKLTLGMHNITFKNDYLRKRYDGMKYHVKAVEEVIYDLKIRGLKANPEPTAAAEPSN